jgi:antitoxin ParD1/3/4
MEILLEPEREQFIQKQLEVGRYQTQDEAINVALLLLEKLDGEYLQWLDEAREKVAVGITQLDRGESRDANQVIEGILDRFRHAKGLVE